MTRTEEVAIPTYPDIVRGAGECYHAQIAAVAAETTGPLGEAASVLAFTLDQALRLGSDLTAADVSLDQAVFADIDEADFDKFVDEWTLGLGADGAPAIVMGTEVADTWSEPQDVAYHTGLAVEALCWGRIDVMRRMMAGTSWVSKIDWSPRRRPFTVHPYDLFPPTHHGQHTWAVLARVVSPDATDWRDLVWRPGTSPSLGDLAYQIERSAYPSKQRLRGRPPNTPRVNWLVTEVIPTLRQSARVILLHGGGGRRGNGWETVDLPLIRAFLGLEPQASPKFTWEHVGKTDLGHDEVDGRLAVSSRALSSAISAAYVTRLRDLLQPYLG